MLNRLMTGWVVAAMLLTGGLPCAGWQPSAQARHDCCAEGTCPDALGETASHSDAHADVSQPSADVCCAMSEDTNQRTTSQFAAAFFALAPLVAVSTAPHTELTPFHQPRPDAVPWALPSTPLHVLLSVFLV